jgi:hypothetical protein
MVAPGVRFAIVVLGVAVAGAGFCSCQALDNFDAFRVTRDAGDIAASLRDLSGPVTVGESPPPCIHDDPVSLYDDCTYGP